MNMTTVALNVFQSCAIDDSEQFDHVIASAQAIGGQAAQAPRQLQVAHQQ